MVVAVLALSGNITAGNITWWYSTVKGQGNFAKAYRLVVANLQRRLPTWAEPSAALAYKRQ